MNLLICFNVGGYRDALCKIGNEMHSDYRYTVTLVLHAHRQYEQQLNSLSTADSCLLITRTLAPRSAAPRLGLEFF